MVKKQKVLVSAPYMQMEIERFLSFFEKNGIEIDLPSVNERIKEDELIKIIAYYDGVVCGDDEFTQKVLDNAKNLKVISKWGTGTDSIEKEYAEKLGIKICSTVNAFSQPVSDSVIGYILCFARSIIQGDREIREEKWNKIKCYTLEEQILGVIGLGNCGMAVAKKASALEMKILGNDIRDIPSVDLKRYNIQFVEKDKIYGECDYISLNTDLNYTSRHMITETELRKMKKNAVLINTSRGAIIKTGDLVRALEEDWIRGAALDVFEEEPLPKESKFRKLKNCILSPHNTNSSYKYWDIVHYNTLRNLVEGLKNERRN